MAPRTKSTLPGAVQDRISGYEKAQKQKLIDLGNSDKPWRDIVIFLQTEIEMSTKMADFKYAIPCFRDDGVYQLNQAIEKIYGASKSSDPEEQPSGGKTNIQTVDVKLADGTRVKVPYGRIDLPEMGTDARIDITYSDETNVLLVTGSCQFKFSSMIDDIIEDTKGFLNVQSIYKDQAIELNSAFYPEILNLSNIDKEFMVLSEQTQYELRPLRARILQPEKCRANGIPLKTGVLLEGPYGTGKTLLAFKLAKEAIAHNWCFIYLKDPKLLAKTLRLSKTLDNNGNGIIVFLEDVDQVTRGKRDEAMQDILNTLDGGDTKNMNVIAVFTTNHIELIEPTFLRGKRIGSIVSMGHLDAKTAMEFIEHTFKDKYKVDHKGMLEACKLVEEQQIVPAFLAEITEKIKINMQFSDGDTVTAEDVRASLTSYLRQVKLAQKKESTTTPGEALAASLREVIMVPEMRDQVKQLYEHHIGK